MSLDQFNGRWASGGTWQWRPVSEWHLGWSEQERQMIDHGVPFPGWWQHQPRDGGRRGDFEHVTYQQVRECVARGHGAATCGRLIASNGVTQFRRICSACGWGINGSTFVPHRVVHQFVADVDSLPVIRDNRDRRWTDACERCGAVGQLERHHWAPWHLFDNAESWPTAYLCHACHTEWHRRTQTGAFWNQRRAS